MYKKIIVAALSASSVIGFFALGMSGCSNNDVYLSHDTRNLANSPEFDSIRPNQVLTTPSASLSGKQSGVVAALKLESQGNQFIAKPSQRIQASATYIYNCVNCKSDSFNQILVGLAGRSAQACIYEGGAHGDGVANFLLKAPAKQGTYDVRFRFAQANNCEEALKNWWNLGSAPSKNTTIGQIIVR